MLVVLVAGSFVMLKALNVAATSSADDPDTVTYRALKQAKQALIQYAVNAPAMTYAELGPGRLPCPDLNGDGAAEAVCELGGANEMTGRFPYRKNVINEIGEIVTVKIVSDEIVDGYGNGLWYSLDEAYRDEDLPNAVINSDTANAMTVVGDDDDDIVAVIIAPGEPVGNQDRSDSPDISDYLESENATLDEIFTREDATVPFNDTVITVTRAEMMAAVEQRVLAEAQKALNTYHNLYGGFPWASTFQDPTDSDFHESIGTRAGQLAIHVSTNGIDRFDTEFALEWSVPTTAILSGGDSPANSCLRARDCVQEYDYGSDTYEFTFDISELNFPGGRCEWEVSTMFVCEGSRVISRRDDVTNPALGAELDRRYDVTIEIYDVAPTVQISAGPSRTRGLELSREPTAPPVTFPAGASVNVEIEITDTLKPDMAPAEAPVTRSITLVETDYFDVFKLTEVQFLIGDDRNLVGDDDSAPAALPRWFTENNWHHFVYYAFAAGEPVGGTGCTPGTDCITVNWSRAGSMADQVIEKARGVVMTAGPDLNVPSIRPTDAFNEYFEGENATIDDTYVRAAVSVNANDQLRILDPNE